jgi:peptidoglycan hydrolase CwlO-like protein
MSEQPSPEETVRALYEDAEKRAASAMEQLVQSDSFGELLARATENTMAITRLGFNAADLVVRNLRIAGRSDIARLGRQLARTEDKLERVLQEVERLRDELAAERARPNGRSARSSNGSGSRSSSSGKSGKSSGSRSKS